MNWQIAPLLIPYALSLLISASVGFYALRRRRVPGAGAFAVFALSEASWTAGYMLELASPTLESKIFWDNIQWIALFGAQSGVFIFAHEYVYGQSRHSRRMWRWFAAAPLIFLPLIFTNALHRLIIPAYELIPGEPFAALDYPFTLPIWLVILYLYVSVFAAIFILLKGLIQSQGMYRGQTATVLLGIAIPVAGGLLTFMGFTLAGQRDITPLTFALGNLVVAWGLFFYKTFDLVPVGRHLAFEGMSDHVMVFDIENRLVDINAVALNLIGRSAAEVIGQPAEVVYASWPNLVERYRGVFDLQTEIVADVDGVPHYFEVKISPVRDRYQQLVGRVVVSRDINARKLAEQALHQRTLQLEAANEQLQVLSRIKDEFVSNVSHELRTPIASMKVNQELIQRNPSRQEELLTRLKRETERLEGIIEDLLRLSRLDQQRSEFQPVLFDLNTLICQYVGDRVALAESRQISLRCQETTNLPAVTADTGLIGQTAGILLTNALNYTPAGGQVIVSTFSRQSQSQQWVGFSVSDTGPGVPLEEQPQLFTRFFRGEAGRKSGAAGTGLGLAIAKTIVEQHQGRIEISSAGIPGKGATFTVLLPILS